MNNQRILAIVRRHGLLTFGHTERIINLLFFPLLNIVIWGMTSVWLKQQTGQAFIIESILTGLILWQIVYRVNLEVARGILEELIHRNMANIFASPLTLSEWVVAMQILGIINMLLVFISCGIAGYALYGVSVFSLGASLIPSMLSLLISGWFIGFLICGLLIYWGLKAQDFVFMVGWFFAPFSAIYYPLDALPTSAQLVGKCLPMTYVFEAMRTKIKTGVIAWDQLGISFLLNFLFLGISLLFFWYMYNARKEIGLTRLE